MYKHLNKSVQHLHNLFEDTVVHHFSGCPHAHILLCNKTALTVHT